MTALKTKHRQTLKSIKSDVTRHRYGDEAHLDTTVKFLGLVLPQSDYPQLQYISQVRRLDRLGHDRRNAALHAHRYGHFRTCTHVVHVHKLAFAACPVAVPP